MLRSKKLKRVEVLNNNQMKIGGYKKEKNIYHLFVDSEALKEHSLKKSDLSLLVVGTAITAAGLAFQNLMLLVIAALYFLEDALLTRLITPALLRRGPHHPERTIHRVNTSPTYTSLPTREGSNLRLRELDFSPSHVPTHLSSGEVTTIVTKGHPTDSFI